MAVRRGMDFFGWLIVLKRFQLGASKDSNLKLSGGRMLLIMK